MSEESTQPQAEESQVEESAPEASAESVEASSEEGQQAELQDVVENAIENGASDKQIQNLIKKFQLKVNGKVVEKEVDLSDENYIKNELQLAAAARQSMSEAAALKKNLEKEINRLKSDPFSVLAELGLDPDQLAQARLEQRVQELSKSPEQQAKEQYDKALAEAREEAKRLREEKEAIEFSKLQEQAAIALEEEIIDALDAHKTLPKSKHITKRVADSLLWAIDNGFPDATAQDVLPLVEKEWREEIAALMDDSPEEMLEMIIGKRNIDRLLTKKAPKLPTKVPNPNTIKATASSVKQDSKEERKKISQRDFFRNLGRGK